MPTQTFNPFTVAALLWTVLTVTMCDANFALSQISFLSSYNLSSLQDVISQKVSSNSQYHIARTSTTL